jgi:antitoxin (DNA-binding transcriptional repressor) of toxin-antitoxin stability system
MKTLTVQEASGSLSELLHCAADGEEITIHDGARAVLLKPVSLPPKNNTKAREALRQLQSRCHVTPDAAEEYLREVHAERVAHENGNGR